ADVASAPGRDGGHATGRRYGIGDSAAPCAAGHSPGTARGRHRRRGPRGNVRVRHTTRTAAAAVDARRRARDLLLRSTGSPPRCWRGHPRRLGWRACEREGPAMTRLTLTVIAGVVIVMVGSPALAQRRDKPADLGESQRDLRETQKRLGEARVKAGEARKREAGLLTELEAI